MRFHIVCTSICLLQITTNLTKQSRRYIDTYKIFRWVSKIKSDKIKILIISNISISYNMAN